MCDLLNPATGLQMRTFDAMNSKYLLMNNIDFSLPPLYTVHGKKDNTVLWKDKPGLYDTVQISLHGVVAYWDQRDHDGSKALFLDSETMPDFKSFATNLSYPAFSNCSIDQNAGNGKKNNGDSYGAINGYMGWNNVSDDVCDYSTHLFVKDFYAGGILDAEQYETCTTDITIRRIQQFIPADGTNISWTNNDADGHLMQSGSFVYNSALPITLTGITVNKSGNTLELSYGDCAYKLATAAPKNNFDIQYIRTTTGWEAHLNSSGNEVVSLAVYNTVGQIIQQRSISLTSGENIFDINLDHNAIYLVEVKGKINTNVSKLAY
jgi:hypothetical protein